MKGGYSVTDKTGGPAFPIVADTEFDSGYHSTVECHGLSMRDYFAAKAIRGLMTHWWWEDAPDGVDFDTIAKHAYQLADAMLAARENQP